MGTSNKTGEKRKEKGTNKTYMYQTMINILSCVVCPCKYKLTLNFIRIKMFRFQVLFTLDENIYYNVVKGRVFLKKDQ